MKRKVSQIDIVTVFHNETNRKQARALEQALANHTSGCLLFAVDNTLENRGFAKGCNLGAKLGASPIIGFINPDAEVKGDFVDSVVNVLKPPVVITGNRFNKPQKDLDEWGVTNWVCGAAMFVLRDWFEKVGGFDERFFLYFDETDLIKTAETQGFQVKPIELPIEHASPKKNNDADAKLKSFWLTESSNRYKAKWKL